MYSKEKNAAINRQLQKKVIKSHLIHSFESLDGITCKLESASSWLPADFEISNEVTHNGKPTLKVVSPNTLDVLPHTRTIYGCIRVRLDFKQDDWSAFNRISFWVFPEKSTYENLHLYMEYVNDGEHPFPNENYLSGGHIANVTPGRWNNVIWEIPELPRDAVSMFQISFMVIGKQANEPKKVVSYLSNFELQEVNADKYMGWDTGDKISFCHSGYAPRDTKQAVTSLCGEDEFYIMNAENNTVAFKSNVEELKNDLGTFRVLNFSGLDNEGEYYIKYADICTPNFIISQNHWIPVIDKIRNFFNMQRCGCMVEGIHTTCHLNAYTEHPDGRKLSVAGGWHDAADLSQGLCNTAEAVYSFLDAAKSIESKNPKLAEKLLNEAHYGLEWMLKTRFEDGYRCVWSGTNVWTENCANGRDSFSTSAERKPFECLCACATEAFAYTVYIDTEPMFAEYCLKCAKEDFEFAMSDFAPFSSEKDVSDICLTAPVQVFAEASFAAAKLYRATNIDKYLEDAVKLAEYVTDCQQSTLPDWEIPILGFFYEEKEKVTPLSYDHRSHEQILIMCLAELCELAPQHKNYKCWNNCLMLYREYINRLMEFSKAYRQIPAGIYFADAPASVTGSGDHKKLRLNTEKYLRQIENGIKLNSGVYLRRMPVALRFRGSFGIQLTKAKAVSVLAKALKDSTLMETAKQQLAWVLGNNPFARSYMYGEGYDFPNMNAPSNSCDVVGEIPVGIHSFEDTDIPYMPTTIQATYFEVWVHPASRMLWTLADLQ